MRGLRCLISDISEQDFHLPDLSALGFNDVVSKLPDPRVSYLGALTCEYGYRVVRNHRLQPSAIPYRCLAANQPEA